MSVLQALNLAKSYKKRAVVNDVSLSVTGGQVVGLLGPNGAGKTTCFYMIVGLVKQDAGRILIDEEDITRLPMHLRARRGLGYLPQEASVFRRLSVEQNILAILETRRELNALQRRDKLEGLLSDFNITAIRHSQGMSLSGGERRRVEIARALAMEPEFILLDEPFAGVDPISVNEIKGIICQLKEKGIGVLITDHNVRDTLDICQHAYIVDDGMVLFQGSPQEILNNADVRRVYLGGDFSL